MSQVHVYQRPPCSYEEGGLICTIPASVSFTLHAINQSLILVLGTALPSPIEGLYLQGVFCIHALDSTRDLTGARPYGL